MDPIELSLFSSRIQAVCEEMGAVLRRAAFSPNIKDRLDFSCAVFDVHGRLCAQAAHIPVHLGSMAYAMADIVTRLDWDPGDMVILNDPYLGGTHLPDVTLIAPLFHAEQLVGFTANRAHHADIGCDAPGSMPLATSLEQEGLVIAPTKLLRRDKMEEAFFRSLLARSRNPTIVRGDLSAQISANRIGLERLDERIGQMGVGAYEKALARLNDYAESLAMAGLETLPRGRYRSSDVMDDDGQGNEDIRIAVCIDIAPRKIRVDFTGTAGQVAGNVNCPLSVAAAAVYYVFYSLMPDDTPACHGSLRLIEIFAPEGCLLNARRPAAVAAGNVETSTRIVDVVLRALSEALPERIPAASHGSMNNIAMGAGHWAYYETLGGGMGAHSQAPGMSAVQTHMTNTLNTPIEVLEMTYPLRIRRYGLRDHSGGAGLYTGGDGLVREFEFLEPTQVTVLGERRRHAPWGLAGGAAGKPAATELNHKPIAGKQSLQVKPGDRLTILTAGGGGWGNIQ